MSVLGLPFWFWGLVCLAIATVFGFVHPQKPVTGLRFFLQRWGHSLVWVCLALACFLGPSHPELARKLAALGGLLYAGFVISSFF